MYRCFACDTPSNLGHHQLCLMMETPEETAQKRRELYRDTRPADYGQEYRKINIASGEDVQLEETVCS